MKINVDNFESVNRVSLGDTIYFGPGLHLEVEPTFLCNRAGRFEAIFDEAEIVDKYTYCRVAYGYKAGLGAFPTYHYDDYIAATIIMKSLFCRLIEIGKLKKSPKAPKVDIQNSQPITVSNDFKPQIIL